MILGVNVLNLPQKHTNNNLPLTCLTQAVADARHGCCAQRIKLLAIVDRLRRAVQTASMEPP